MAEIQGCHLIGSVPYKDTETVLRKCTAGMPGRLRRIPDGETGVRKDFVFFQRNIFDAYPDTVVPMAWNVAPRSQEFTEEEIKKGLQALKESKIETGYDDAAIESYGVFCKLRDEGVIPPGVRFQVCLPTIANSLAHVQRPLQALVEPLYEESLFRALRKIQDTIPHDDLSFQFDCAVETGMWELSRGVDVSIFKPWWEGDIAQYIIDFTVRMLSQVEQDIELGLHNCYGDMAHKHYYEPDSLAGVVERGIRLFQASPHPINYFHCPVPKSALNNLDGYFAPLKELQPFLKKHDTELILGLIHEYHPEMSQEMVNAASKVVPKFTIATECGGGRMTEDAWVDAMQMSADFSKPIA